MNYSPLLLIIDDEITILKTLKDALEDENYRIEILSEGNKTLATIGKLIPDLVLLDIFMPNCNGLKLLEQIKKEYPQQQVMIISGFGNIAMAIEATKKGALDFIEKPLNLDEILSKINFLKTYDHHQNKSVEFSESVETYGIVGQSYLFLELIQQINQIALLKFPLLIYGQYGTGKTLLAKYIHKKNQFKDDNFYLINCSKLNNEDFDKKLEEIRSKKTGTCFFKNINNLTSLGQKKLLFFIEEYYEKHSEKNLKIIASSCEPLFNLYKEKKFNGSLFYKLNITPIEIPSLNKRRYDIPLLVDYYLKKANKEHSKNIVLNTQSIRFLRNYNWHGNISELKMIINKMVCTTLSNDQIITPQFMLSHLSEKKTQFLEEQSYSKFNSLAEATNEFEKNFLLYLLRKNKYDIKQLSDRLNLTTVELRDKITKFDIEIKN